MSNKKIVININDKQSIKDAIKEVRAYRRMIVSGSEKLTKRLAKTASAEARKGYSTAEYAGTNDVTVSTEPVDKLRTRVTADGEAALFIEFGTGINKSDAPEARADLKSGNVVGHGQYGHHLGRFKTGWRYEGDPGSNHPSDTYVIPQGQPHEGMVHTKGNDATPAMYLAKKKAQAELPDIVKEVFKQ